VTELAKMAEFSHFLETKMETKMEIVQQSIITLGVRQESGVTQPAKVAQFHHFLESEMEQIWRN